MILARVSRLLGPNAWQKTGRLVVAQWLLRELAHRMSIDFEEFPKDINGNKELARDVVQSNYERIMIHLAMVKKAGTRSFDEGGVMTTNVNSTILLTEPFTPTILMAGVLSSVISHPIVLGSVVAFVASFAVALVKKYISKEAHPYIHALAKFDLSIGLGLLVAYMQFYGDRKSTRLNSSHSQQSRMPSSA